MLACEHIAKRQPDVDPAVRHIKVVADQIGGGSDHYWCESCAEEYALSPANRSDTHWSDVYGKLRNQLIPVCSACFEWLVD